MSSSILVPGHEKTRLRLVDRPLLVAPLLFIFTLLVRILFFLTYMHGQVPTGGDTLAYTLPALGMMRGEGYNLGGAPTANNPPLYSFYIAVMYTIFGESNSFVVISQQLLSALGVVFLYLIGRQMAVVPFLNILAAVLMAIHLDVNVWTNWVQSDALGLFLVLVALWLATRYERTMHWAPAAAAVAITGLAVLTRPIFASFVPLLLLWILFQQPNIQERIRLFTISVATLLLIMSPWMIRNGLVMGKAYPLSSKPVLWWDMQSYTPLPKGYGFDNQTWRVVALSESGNQQLSEVETEEILRQVTLTRIVSNPLEHMQVSWKRFNSTIAPTMTRFSWFRMAYDSLYWLFILAGALCCVVYHRHLPKPAVVVLLALFALSQLLVISLVVDDGDWRYRTPMIPALLLLAVSGYTAAIGRLDRNNGSRFENT